MVSQLILVDTAQIKALTTRENRDGYLPNFRRCEDEDHMVWRFLQRLQQTIKGLPRKHVDFIDDIDLVPRRNGLITHPFN